MGGGDKGIRGDCHVVDYVPNVFLARRSVLLASPWDPTFKVGEHEDFFLRLRTQNVSVGTCMQATLDHLSKLGWRAPRTSGQTSYKKERFRALYFQCLALTASNESRMLAPRLSDRSSSRLADGLNQYKDDLNV